MFLLHLLLLLFLHLSWFLLPLRTRSLRGRGPERGLIAKLFVVVPFDQLERAEEAPQQRPARRLEVLVARLCTQQLAQGNMSIKISDVVAL